MFFISIIHTLVGRFLIQTNYFPVDVENQNNTIIMSNRGTDMLSIPMFEWIEMLNYTVDYGDKTCSENKLGNPRKETFVKILKHWKEISKRFNIPYFLVHGSLIGAVRNGDFIPWDHDMDIMIDKDYYNVIASLENNDRDLNVNVVVHKDFREHYEDEHYEDNRRKKNCLGQVKNTLLY